MHSRFNKSQTAILETAFTNNCYLNRTILLHLTKQTGVETETIRNWFSTKRRRLKKAEKEGTLSTKSKYNSNSQIHACSAGVGGGEET